MRVECIQELTIWIKLFPKVFISDLQAFNYLRKLTIDGVSIEIYMNLFSNTS